jgi:hypothetical protein
LNQEDRITPYGEPLPKEYETLTREELKNRLQVFISGLLENNFEKLTNMIYRHDVKEDKFYEALNEDSIEKQAAVIADLVIEREMEKVATRRAYRKYREGKELGGDNPE